VRRGLLPLFAAGCAAGAPQVRVSDWPLRDIGGSIEVRAPRELALVSKQFVHEHLVVLEEDDRLSIGFLFFGVSGEGCRNRTDMLGPDAVPIVIGTLPGVDQQWRHFESGRYHRQVTLTLSKRDGSGEDCVAVMYGGLPAPAKSTADAIISTIDRKRR